MDNPIASKMTFYTAAWLKHNGYFEEIRELDTVEDMKLFVWSHCKMYVFNIDSFRKGQKLVDYDKLFQIIKSDSLLD